METAQNSRHTTRNPGSVGDGLVSVVIPTLEEQERIPLLVANLQSLRPPPAFEVILADGGSRDGTPARFDELVSRGGPWASARAIRSGRTGRAWQMNEGAQAARGTVLLFLHADTLLPEEALVLVAAALRDPGVVGGGFRHRFDAAAPIARVVSAWATARSRLRRIHYGDQAIFVRREVFGAIGGYPEVALFEDLGLSKAMRARGRVVTLKAAALTSARRLRSRGAVWTVALFGWLKLRYMFGADPARLSIRYPDVR